jgi:hypothetical protein
MTFIATAACPPRSCFATGWPIDHACLQRLYAGQASRRFFGIFKRSSADCSAMQWRVGKPYRATPVSSARTLFETAREEQPHVDLIATSILSAAISGWTFSASTIRIW